MKADKMKNLRNFLVGTAKSDKGTTGTRIHGGSWSAESLKISEGRKMVEASVKSDSTCCTDTSTTCSVDMSSKSASLSGSTSSDLPKCPPLRTRSALKRFSTTSKSTPKRFRIRFEDQIEYRNIMGRHDYTEEELQTCWLSCEEYSLITESCCKQIRKLENSSSTGSDRHNKGSRSTQWRGLESHTKHAALSKTKNRRLAWDTVLQEQEEQIMLGVIDDEAIALQYSHVASSCQLWAVRVALQDQREAEAVYDDMLDDYHYKNKINRT